MLFYIAGKKCQQTHLFASTLGAIIFLYPCVSLLQTLSLLYRYIHM